MKLLVLDSNCSKCAFNMFLRDCDQAIYVPTTEEAAKALGKDCFDFVILDGALASPKVLQEWRAQSKMLPPVYFLSDDAAKNRHAIEAGATGADSKRNLLFVVNMFVTQRKAAESGGR